jgi:hypothetical protein
MKDHKTRNNSITYPRMEYWGKGLAGRRLFGSVEMADSGEGT